MERRFGQIRFRELLLVDSVRHVIAQLGHHVQCGSLPDLGVKGQALDLCAQLSLPDRVLKELQCTIEVSITVGLIHVVQGGRP